MPVYIPSETGYYEDAFKIFTICIESLLATVHQSRMDITIIDNASISKVQKYLQPKIESGQIDQYVRNTVNRGKADAIIGLGKASYEPFITIADSDVLFLPGWLDQVETIYELFPAAGVVCPFPAPHLVHHHCNSAWVRHFFALRKRKAVSRIALETYEKNLGISNFFRPSIWRSQWCLSKNGVDALLGSSHFVATYRSTVFSTLHYSPKRMGLKGGLRGIEQQVDRRGMSRLSCVENHVLHMGNKLEPWMIVREAIVQDNSDIQRNLQLQPSNCLQYFPGISSMAITYLFVAYDRLRDLVVDHLTLNVSGSNNTN